MYFDPRHYHYPGIGSGMERRKNIKKKSGYQGEGKRETGEKRPKMAQTVGEKGLYLLAMIVLICAIRVVPLSAVPPCKYRKQAYLKWTSARHGGILLYLP